MAGDNNDKSNLPDPDDYWPFPDDLDEYEREFSESLEGYNILPDPNFEEKKKRAEETARRTLTSEHPGRITEELREKLPPGLLAYWRGEAPTPYSDPTGWDEFRKTLKSSNDLWRTKPAGSGRNMDHPQDQPEGAPYTEDNPE